MLTRKNILKRIGFHALALAAASLFILSLALAIRDIREAVPTVTKSAAEFVVEWEATKDSIRAGKDTATKTKKEPKPKKED